MVEPLKQGGVVMRSRTTCSATATNPGKVPRPHFVHIKPPRPDRHRPHGSAPAGGEPLPSLRRPRPTGQYGYSPSLGRHPIRIARYRGSTYWQTP